MEDRLRDLEAQVLMLQHVGAAAWSNLIRQTANWHETYDRIVDESLGGLREARDRQTTAAARDAFDAILKHEAGFWDQVREQVAPKS